MQELEQYFEDYNVGDKRTTPGRTITETDVVMHAMHSGDFGPLMRRDISTQKWRTNLWFSKRKLRRDLKLENVPKITKCPDLALLYIKNCLKSTTS